MSPARAFAYASLAVATAAPGCAASAPAPRPEPRPASIASAAGSRAPAGSSPTAPQLPENPPSASAAAVASASPSTSASALPPSWAPAPSPSGAVGQPAAGLERRFARVRSGDATATDIPFSIDVPPPWATVTGARDAAFRACHAEPVFGRLRVATMPCPGALEACIASHEDDGAKLAIRERVSPTRIWALHDGIADGRRTVSGTLYVTDATTQATVTCGTWLLSGPDLPLFAKYKTACDSLVLRPAPLPKAITPAAAARPSAEDLAAPEQTEKQKAIADVALAFVAAAAKRDAKAAGPLVARAAQCASITSAPTCTKRSNETMAAMPKPLEKVPAGFVAGSVVQRDGSAGERVVWVTVHRKGDECADAVAVPVMEHEGSYYVMAWALRRWSDWK